MNDNSSSKNLKVSGIGVLGLLGVLVFVVIPGGIVALLATGGSQAGVTPTHTLAPTYIPVPTFTPTPAQTPLRRTIAVCAIEDVPEPPFSNLDYETWETSYILWSLELGGPAPASQLPRSATEIYLCWSLSTAMNST